MSIKDIGKNMFIRLIKWVDMRYVISRRAQQCEILAQQTGQSFEDLYTNK
jgi:hypothetical protein